MQKKDLTEINKIVLMNFSGIYRQQQFYKGKEVSWVEVQDIPGTNCYCDAEAMHELRSRISEFSGNEIHFVDSGNYHYMSRIWLDKQKEPFRLLVLDNHTDMQRPAFDGLLSCGGWIAAALEELANLREVILVGPDEEAYEQVEPELVDRVRFFSREKLSVQPEEIGAFIEAIPTDLPLYVSVDKDILCPAEVHTTWSQGNMTLTGLLRFLEAVRKHVALGGGHIAGVDICGESDTDRNEGNRSNDTANRILLEFWL